jgi:hypothetical protein
MFHLAHSGQGTRPGCLYQSQVDTQALLRRPAAKSLHVRGSQTVIDAVAWNARQRPDTSMPAPAPPIWV